ncbi:MAG: hypothetical protein IJH12_09025 [Clostridia bacterium]|nr:hypothetical protein [Clostridia bacterium]
MGNNKDISTIVIYLTKLQNAMQLCKENPCEQNISYYKKYLKLYIDEYHSMFGCNPNMDMFKEFQEDLNSTEKEKE